MLRLELGSREWFEFRHVVEVFFTLKHMTQDFMSYGEELLIYILLSLKLALTDFLATYNVDVASCGCVKESIVTPNTVC